MIKLVVVEDGSGLASELWDGAHPAASSILAYPEGRAALAAARRQGRLDKHEHSEALAAFENLQSELISIGVDAGLAQRGGELAEDFGLRGYDAVHLATALELGDEEIVVVTWDHDLADAAKKAGLGLSGTD